MLRSKLPLTLGGGAPSELSAPVTDVRRATQKNTFGSRLLAAFAVAAAGFAVAFTSPPAAANIVKDTSVTALGQGFGAVPRLLTDQFNAPPPEVACDGFVGGVFKTGPTACDTHDATFQGNGLINTDHTTGANKNSGDVSPSGLSDKNAPANLASLGITNASQILINYNPSQTGAAPQSDIYDLTLKFYNGSGTEIISIDGGCGTSCTGTASDPLYFADTGTNLGNGGTGFVLALDATQAAAVNIACGAHLTGCANVTGEAQIALSNDGPDSFTLFSSALAAPAPPIGHGIPVLLAVGGLLFGAKLRERSKKRSPLGAASRRAA